MVTKIFSVRDIKIGTYGPLMNVINEIQATRALHMAANDPTVQISMFPEDFELMQMGEFDDISGRITLLDNPKFIVGAISLRKQQLDERAVSELQKMEMKAKREAQNAKK